MIFPPMNQPDKAIRTSSRANAAQPRAVDARQPPGATTVMDLLNGYPPVNIQKAIENGDRNSGFSH